MQYSQVEMIDTEDISVSRRPASSRSFIRGTGGVVGGVMLGLAFIGLSLGGALPRLPWAFEEPDSSESCWPIEEPDSAPRSLRQGLRWLARGEQAEDSAAAKRQKPSGGSDLCKIRVPLKDWPATLAQLVASSSWTQHLTYGLQQDGSVLTPQERNYFIGAGFPPHHIPLAHAYQSLSYAPFRHEHVGVLPLRLPPLQAG